MSLCSKTFPPVSTLVCARAGGHVGRHDDGRGYRWRTGSARLIPPAWVRRPELASLSAVGPVVDLAAKWGA